MSDTGWIAIVIGAVIVIVVVVAIVFRGHFSGSVELPDGSRVTAAAGRQPKSVRPRSATITDVEAGGSVRATAAGDASVTRAKAHTGDITANAGVTNEDTNPKE